MLYILIHVMSLYSFSFFFFIFFLLVPGFVKEGKKDGPAATI